MSNLHLIESALARAYTGYHRPISRKAAAVLQSMAGNHGFTDGNKLTGYRPTVIAENIAAGAAGLFNLDGTLEQWGLSPKHRANITIARMKEFGIGHAVAADGKTVFWAAVYATR